MRVLLLISLFLGLTACRTPRQFEADRLAQQRTLERQRELEEQRRQERAQLIMEDTQADLSDLQQELSALQRDLNAKATNLDLQNLDRRIAALEEQLRQLDAQRAQDREDIIRVLSERIAGMMNNRPTAAGGRKHTVGAGETLSAIAAAYGVSGRAIIQANNLSNPNALRIGQTLIIPTN
jgi:nucleoid-associated protein YgaU